MADVHRPHIPVAVFMGIIGAIAPLVMRGPPRHLRFCAILSAATHPPATSACHPIPHIWPAPEQHPRPIIRFAAYFPSRSSLWAFMPHCRILAQNHTPTDTIFASVVRAITIIMPAFGTMPAPWDYPLAEHFLAMFGHIFRMRIIGLRRRDLRNRITHGPDPEPSYRRQGAAPFHPHSRTILLPPFPGYDELPSVPVRWANRFE